MKLQKKIGGYFISVSLIVLILSGIVSYFVIKSLVLEEVDETLKAEKDNLISQMQKSQNPGLIFGNHSYRLEVFPIPKDKKVVQTLSDTIIFVGEEGEGVPFRQLNTSVTVKNNNYQIFLRRSLIERDDLITGLSVLLVIIFFLVFIALNLINYYGEKKWWKPFYDTLSKLSVFKIDQNEVLNLPLPEIDEFAELNRTINMMTRKLQKDFRNLKEFSENAAHEMQTPLAIIRSKLDVMIQDQALSEKQFDSIRSLYNAVNRLDRLNKSLNLLTKIENHEFTQKEDVNISQLISQQINNLKELIESKSLQVYLDIESGIVVQINPFIADALISNLLINAIKHNFENGKIAVELTREKFVIKNTGKPPQVSTKKLFERFKKDNQTSDSPGLGLSIVKKICELNNLKIKYEFKQNLHVVTIGFAKFNTK